MSTVLWANYLVDGKVVCDESDKYALYKFTRKLDALSAKLGIPEFSAAFDNTDLMINLDQAELKPGMESTDEAMAIDGTWVDANDALNTLQTLLETVRSENIRFGLLGNAHDDVVSELKESIEFAKEAVSKSAKFNFAIVM